MRRKKITIVGAGQVGGTTAQRLVEGGSAPDVVLLDIDRGLAEGKALDLAESAPLLGCDARIRGTSDYADTRDSDIVVITSGVPRKPGMSRDDLLSTNAKIVREVTRQVAAVSPNAILIVVSNPLDAMAHVAFTESKFPRERVLGMAGVLDSSRMAAFIAEDLQVSVESVFAIVMGGHGDSMVPLPRYTTVAGVPLTELMDKKRIDRLVQRTRDAGAEIVKLLKTGSAFYGPSAAVAEMIDAIVHDRKKILPCAVRCQGEYGVRNLFLGVPVRIGLGGMEAIVEYALTPEEKASLQKSVDQVNELCAAVGRMV